MRTYTSSLIENDAVNHVLPRTPQLALRASHLYLVTVHDLQDLRHALIRGQVPPDLEVKLIKLALGDLGRRFIEQNCRTIIALLQAAHEGSFKEARQEDCERLLRVLAYVRKDEDAIADYRVDGFTDDQQELRAAITQLAPMLRNFKAWRLRHQVPQIWNGVAQQKPVERTYFQRITEEENL